MVVAGSTSSSRGVRQCAGCPVVGPDRLAPAIVSTAFPEVHRSSGDLRAFGAGAQAPYRRGGIAPLAVGVCGERLGAAVGEPVIAPVTAVDDLGALRRDQTFGA